MANVLQTLFDSAFSVVNSEKVKLDEEKAAALSSKLGMIASEIEMAAAQIEGPISEAQSLWTGEAAESFFAELSKLVNSTKEIGVKVGENRRSVDSAAAIIMAADKKNIQNVESLSGRSAFQIK